MNALEDKLIQKAQQGDSEAFEKLILQYENRIYAIAFKVFKNETDAYDVAQEICIKIYRKLDQFRFDSAFSTWLHRISMNTAIDEYRKQKRKYQRETSMDDTVEQDEGQVSRQFKDAADTPEQAMLRKERVQAVWDGLEQLKEEQRQIIILKDLEGKSYQEISEQLDIGLGTVKSRLARARIALKKVLEDLVEQNLL